MLFDKFRNLIRSRLLTRDRDTWEVDYSRYLDDLNHESSQEDSYQSYTQPEPGRVNTREAGYYANLELKEGADFPEIKAAYKRLVKKYHPDKFHHDEQKRKYAEQVTQKLNEAYRYFEDKFGQK
jgi:DnaJ-domain-containing protein 1